MTASGYGNWGKEVLRMSADIEDVLTQGGYFIKMLYSYRSCGKAIPLGGVADRVEEKQTFNETLFALLRAEVVKMVDLMKYCAVLVDFVCTSIEVYNTFRQAHRLFPPDVLVGIVEVFDLVIKLDALKDVKVCLKNDFAFYKRALHGMKASLSEAKELEEEVYRLQMFLSNPVHSKGYLASTLRDRLKQVRGGHEAALVRVVEQCLHEVDEKKQKHTTKRFSCDDRHRARRVLPYLFYMLDEHLVDGSGTNAFKTKVFQFDKCFPVMKSRPVVPLMFEMIVDVFSVLKKCPNHATISEIFGKNAFKVSPKVVQSYSMVGKEAQDIVSRQQQCQARVVAVVNELQMSVGTKAGQIADRPAAPRTAQACGEAYEAVRDALHAVGNATTSTLTQASWKFFCPVVSVDNKKPHHKVQYARSVLYNYNEEEKDALVDVINGTKLLTQELSRFEDVLVPALQQHVHGLLQTFAQGTLQVMLRKCHKNKKHEAVLMCVALQRLISDWVEGSEPDDVYLLRRKDRAKIQDKFAWKPRQAGPLQSQTVLLRHLLAALFDSSSQGMMSGKGLFRSRIFDSAVVKEMETLYQAAANFSDVLAFGNTVSGLSNFSSLWYREFYLEVEKQSQFPIALSLPWILIEHIIFKPAAPKMDKIFRVLDLYNDAAFTALHSLGQQYFYDEVEAELNLVFDQLLFMLNRHLYEYFKNIAASLQVDPLAMKTLESKSKQSFTVQKNPIYDAIIHTRDIRLLGRQLDIHNLLSETLEHEIYEDVDKCLGALERLDLCNIFQFDALVRVVEQTHAVIGEYFSIAPFDQIMNTVNESICIGRQPGRLAKYVLRDLRHNVLPRMVYCDSKESYFVYNKDAGVKKKKHLASVKKRSLARKSHLLFGSRYHSIFVDGFSFRELYLSQAHTRVLFRVLKPYGLNLVLSEVLTFVSVHMEQKICPYLRTLLPGVKPVILPNWQMLTNVNYLAVEATVKGFFKFQDVTNEVFCAFKELGNMLGLLRMFDLSIAKGKDASTVPDSSMRILPLQSKKAKQREPVVSEEHAPLDRVTELLLDDDTEDVPLLPRTSESFLKKGLEIIGDVLARDIPREDAVFKDSLPRLFGSLFFILCRPTTYVIGREVRSGKHTLYDEHGEGLLFGGCALVSGLRIADVFREKNYNSHILKVHAFEVVQEEEDKQSKKQRKSIGIVDAETKAEIQVYLRTAKVVENVLDHYLSELERFNPANFDITTPTILPDRKVSGVKPARESLMFRRHSTEEDDTTESININATLEAREPIKARLSEGAPRVTLAKSTSIKEAYCTPPAKVDAPKPAPVVDPARVDTLGPKYEKFKNMLKMGVPEGAVRAKMALEHVDASPLFGESPGSESSAAHAPPMNLGDVIAAIDKRIVEPALSLEGNGQVLETDESEEDYMCLAYVLYDYEANDDDELSFQEGQFIEVTEKHEDDWWYGRIQGGHQSGMFPMNYVSRVLQHEGTKYLMHIGSNEIFAPDDQDVCLGIFDEAGQTLIDLSGKVISWASAKLL
jgi:cytoplasmic FMR1 interacting protein